MKKTYNLNKNFYFIIFIILKFTISYSMEYSNCNKLWGVTQDANGKMLYKVGMYMCIEDPYNIYRSSGVSLPSTSLISNVIQGNTTKNSTNTTKNSTNTTKNSTNTTKNSTNTTNNENNTFIISPKNDFESKNITENLTSNNFDIYEKNSSTSTPPLVVQTSTFPPTTLLPETTTSMIKINKTNQTFGFTNLRSSSNKQISTENRGPDVILIIVISSVVCFVLSCSVVAVYYIKKKRKEESDSNKIQEESLPEQHIKQPQPYKHRTKQGKRVHPGKNNVKLTVDTSKGRELKINHKALTPNTRQILNESESSIKNWYKKTFRDEIKQCKDDIPMPPVSKVPSLTLPPNANSTTSTSKFKNNVKKLINLKEMEIKRNNTKPVINKHHSKPANKNNINHFAR